MLKRSLSDDCALGSGQLKLPSSTDHRGSCPTRTVFLSKMSERFEQETKLAYIAGILMKHYPHAMSASGATIEHFNNDGPFTEKI